MATHPRTSAPASIRPSLRRRPRSRLRPVAAVATLAVLVSCGGDDDADRLGDDVDEIVDDVEADAEDIGADVSAAVADAGEDAVEVAVRNFASIQGEQEFADAGYDIDGGLTCTADATADLDDVAVDCSGRTADGRLATLTGTTSELPGESLTELEGEFVGTVDGQEVFRTDALG